MPTSSGAVYVDVKANTNPFERSMSGLGGIASRMGGMLTKALSVAALAAFGKQCIDVASDLAEVQNVVDVTFPHMSAQINEWASNAITQFGLSETMAKRYAGTLGTMAESLGIAESSAYDMATAIAGLSGDVASFYNITQDEAFEKLQSIFTGTVQPLRQFGISMTQAALDSYALANGFGKTVSEMSEAEKAMLRFAYVSDALANAQGDFARTSNGWANQIRILQLRFEELKAAVGQSLIMVLTPVIQVINTIIGALTAAANAVYRFLSALAATGIGRLAKGASNAIAGLSGSSAAAAGSTSDLADAQTAAAGAAGAQNAAQTKLNRTLAGFDRINKLVAESASGGGGGGGGGISDTFSALDDAGDSAGMLQKALDSIEVPQRLIDAFGRLKEAARGLADTIGEGLGWAYENVLKPLGSWTINEMAPRLIDALASGLHALDETLQTLAPVFSEVWENVLRPVFVAMGEFLEMSAEGWRLFFDNWSELMVKARPYVEEFSKWFGEVLKPIGDWIGKFMDFLRDFSKGLGDFIDGLLSGDWEKARLGVEEMGDAWARLNTKDIVLGAKISGLEETEKMGRAWSGITDKGARLSAEFAQGPEEVKDGWTSRMAGVTDKTATISYKYSNTYEAWKESWGKRLGAFSNKTATISYKYSNTYAAWKDSWLSRLKAFPNKTATVTYKFSNTYAAWSSQWRDRLRAFSDKTATITYNVRKTGISTIEALASGGGKISLRAYAKGGWIARNTPHLAVIGDNTREGEIVSPESKFQTMLDKAAGQGPDAEVVALLSQLLAAVREQDRGVYLDGRDITRSVVSNINRQVQSTGRSPLLV